MEYINLPYIVFRNGIVIGSGAQFLTLTGYRFQDIQGLRLEYLFSETLKVSIELSELQSSYKGAFLFTKNLEPKEVDISIWTCDKEIVVVIEEIADSGIDHLFPYMAQQLNYNCVGTAIVLAKDFVLLKSNQLALDCFEEPFNISERSIGKSIREICATTGQAGLQAVFQQVVATGELFVDREFALFGSNDITLYIDILVVPIFVNGSVKYLIQTVRNVTEEVLRRNVLEEQNKSYTHVRKLTDELRNIIESTDEFIWSVNREYRLLYSNSSYKNYINKSLGFVLKEGLLISELFPEREALVWMELFERSISDGKFQVDLKSQIDDRLFTFNFYPIYLDSEIVEIACFGKDLTERMRTEQSIVSQNAILESTVKERTAELQQMVKNLQNWTLKLSHDVKASLRDIELCADNIMGNVDIRANATRILQLSKDMTLFTLEVMKYEMCLRRKLVKEDVKIKKIFVSTYKMLREKYPNHSLLAFETGFPLLSGDYLLLQQVVYNILSNAMKFSSNKEKPAITIGCKAVNNEYIIYVEDNGVGFDMNDAAKLFNAFERLHDKEDFDGTGLGLTTVRNIIQRHGGRTWIESEPGVRTVIYFSLPI